MRSPLALHWRIVLLGVALFCLSACGATAPLATERVTAATATPAATRVAPATTAPLAAPVCPNAPVTLSVKVYYLPRVDFYDGLALVKVGEKYGFLDRCGTFVVEPQYTSASPFSEGLAAVYINGKWGYLDTHGALVIPASYDYAGPFSEGLAAVTVGDMIRFIDPTGAEVIAPQFAGVRDTAYKSVFSDGLAAIAARDANGNIKWGYVDHSGRFVIPPQFGSAARFAEGLALVNSSPGIDDIFIDTTGAVVIAVPKGRGVYSDFAGGLAVVKEGGHYGYMNRTGRLVTPLQFDNAYPLKDGRGLVEINHRHGYIDSSGAYALPLQYANASHYSEGWASVWLTNDLGSEACINPQGAVVLQLPDGGCPTFHDGVGVLPLKGGSEEVVVDRTGKVLFSYVVEHPKPVP